MQTQVAPFNWVRIIVSGVIAFIYYIWSTKTYPDWKMFAPWSLVHIVVVVVVIFMSGSVKWRSRYKQAHVTCNGFSGSIIGQPVYVRDPSIHPEFYWAVFNTGYSQHPYPTPGKLATLIVPGKQAIPSGENYNCQTMVKRTTQLPYVIKDFFRENPGVYNEENVIFGRYSKEYLDYSGADEDLITEIKSLNHLIDQLQRHQRRDFSGLQEVANIGAKLSRKPGIVKRMAEKFKEKPEENE